MRGRRKNNNKSDNLIIKRASRWWVLRKKKNKISGHVYNQKMKASFVKRVILLAWKVLDTFYDVSLYVEWIVENKKGYVVRGIIRERIK